MKRSKWKGVYVKPANYKILSNSILKVSRSSSIIPGFIGQTFKVHAGKIFKEILIVEKMLGHKFGEFSKTRSEFGFKKKK